MAEERKAEGISESDSDGQKFYLRKKLVRMFKSRELTEFLDKYEASGGKLDPKDKVQMFDNLKLLKNQMKNQKGLG